MGLLPLIIYCGAISISCGVSIRVINSPSRSAVGKETRKPKPKQSANSPENTTTQRGQEREGNTRESHKKRHKQKNQTPKSPLATPAVRC